MDELMQCALESFPNFVVADAKGRIVYLNEGYARLLGTTSRAAIGRPVSEVIPNTRLNIVLKTGQAEMGSIMTLYDHVTEREITLVCNRIPVRKDGKCIGVLAATTMGNIFEVTRLYEELEHIRLENQKYKAELEALRNSIKPLDRVIGKSCTIREVKQTISDYADSNLTFLITGETGVGKEVFARAIHQSSGRSLQSYVKINCAAIPGTLLESELFGYADGAFSGAAKGGKIGKFELANHGTLLLDEIGEMPLDLQSKLLRVLQEKEIERVGGIKSVEVDVRIICCTNQNLEKMVQEGRFREDLYYRINVVELNIPPLRERLGDIPPLCSFFLEKVNEENGYAITGLEEDVLTLFDAYPWPGNVRELEHVIERAAVRCKSGMMTTRHVDFLAARASRQREQTQLEPASLRERTQQAELESILQALDRTGGNKTKAARLLGIDRSRLYSKLKKYHLGSP